MNVCKWTLDQPLPDRSLGFVLISANWDGTRLLERSENSGRGARVRWGGSGYLCRSILGYAC